MLKIIVQFTAWETKLTEYKLLFNQLNDRYVHQKDIFLIRISKRRAQNKVCNFIL